MGDLSETTTETRKTFQYPRLPTSEPTSEQARARERALRRCRHGSHAAVGERREAGRRRGGTVPDDQQKADLPGSTEAMPEAAAVPSHQLLQDGVFSMRACSRGPRVGAGGGSARAAASPAGGPPSP
jgi:hypothetical protein